MHGNATAGLALLIVRLPHGHILCAVKHYRETPRRTWEVLGYDVSKQAVGARSRSAARIAIVSNLCTDHPEKVIDGVGFALLKFALLNRNAHRSLLQCRLLDVVNGGVAGPLRVVNHAHRPRGMARLIRAMDTPVSCRFTTSTMPNAPCRRRSVSWRCRYFINVLFDTTFGIAVRLLRIACACAAQQRAIARLGSARRHN